MDSKNRRSSILKKIPEAETTVEITNKLKRRISFSGRKSVRVFCNEEEAKAWNNSYEESDHAVNASGESEQRISLPILNAKVQAANKENVCIAKITSTGKEDPVLNYSTHGNSFPGTKSKSFDSALYTTEDFINISHCADNFLIENSVDITLHDRERPGLERPKVKSLKSSSFKQLERKERMEEPSVFDEGGEVVRKSNTVDVFSNVKEANSGNNVAQTQGNISIDLDCTILNEPNTKSKHVLSKTYLPNEDIGVSLNVEDKENCLLVDAAVSGNVSDMEIASPALERDNAFHRQELSEKHQRRLTPEENKSEVPMEISMQMSSFHEPNQSIVRDKSLDISRNSHYRCSQLKLDTSLELASTPDLRRGSESSVLVKSKSNLIPVRRFTARKETAKDREEAMHKVQDRSSLGVNKNQISCRYLRSCAQATVENNLNKKEDNALQKNDLKKGVQNVLQSANKDNNGGSCGTKDKNELSLPLSDKMKKIEYIYEGNEKLNLRQLNDEIELGKIHFPERSRETLLAENLHVQKSQNLPDVREIKGVSAKRILLKPLNMHLINDAPMSQSLENDSKPLLKPKDSQTRAKSSECDLRIGTSKSVDLAKCIDDSDMELDTGFLAQVKLGDEAVPESSSKCSSSKRQTVYFHEGITVDETTCFAENTRAIEPQSILLSNQSLTVEGRPMSVHKPKKFRVTKNERGKKTRETICCAKDMSIAVDDSVRVDEIEPKAEVETKLQAQTSHRPTDDCKSVEIWKLSSVNLQNESEVRDEVLHRKLENVQDCLPKPDQGFYHRKGSELDGEDNANQIQSIETIKSETIWCDKDMSIAFDDSVRVDEIETKAEVETKLQAQTSHRHSDDSKNIEIWRLSSVNLKNESLVTAEVLRRKPENIQDCLPKPDQGFYHRKGSKLDGEDNANQIQSIQTIKSETIWCDKDISIAVDDSVRVDELETKAEVETKLQAQTCHRHSDDSKNIEIWKLSSVNLKNESEVEAEVLSRKPENLPDWLSKPQQGFSHRNGSKLGAQDNPNEIQLRSNKSRILNENIHHKAEQSNLTLYYNKDIDLDNSISMSRRVEEDVAPEKELDIEELGDVTAKPEDNYRIQRRKTVTAEKDMDLECSLYQVAGRKYSPNKFVNITENMEEENSFSLSLKALKTRGRKTIVYLNNNEIDKITSPPANNVNEERFRQWFEGTPHRSVIEFEEYERETRIDPDYCLESTNNGTTTKPKFGLSTSEVDDIKPDLSVKCEPKVADTSSRAEEKEINLLDESEPKTILIDDTQDELKIISLITPMAKVNTQKRSTAHLTPGYPVAKRRLTQLFYNCGLEETLPSQNIKENCNSSGDFDREFLKLNMNESVENIKRETLIAEETVSAKGESKRENELGSNSSECVPIIAESFEKESPHPQKVDESISNQSWGDIAVPRRATGFSNSKERPANVNEYYSLREQNVESVVRDEGAGERASFVESCDSAPANNIANLKKRYVDLVCDSQISLDGKEETQLNILEDILGEDERNELVAIDTIEPEEPDKHSDNQKPHSTEPAGSIQVETMHDASVVCRKCKRCQQTTFLSESAATVADSFALPAVGPVPLMDRLKQIRSKPTIAEVNEYWRRKSLELAYPLKDTEANTTQEHIDQEILEYKSRIKTIEIEIAENRSRQAKILDKPYALRLDALLRSSLPNWIFDHQTKAGKAFVFTHRKIATFSLQISYSENDPFGSDITIKGIKLCPNNFPKKSWKPFHHILDFELRLELPYDMSTLCGRSDVDSVLEMLKEIDRICVNVEQFCRCLWTLLCRERSSLVMEGNSIYIRKVVRRLLEQDGCQSVDETVFRIEVRNVRKICFKDIATPPLHLFREDIEHLPIGLDFLSAFLKDPMSHLRKPEH